MDTSRNYILKDSVITGVLLVIAALCWLTFILYKQPLSTSSIFPVEPFDRDRWLSGASMNPNFECLPRAHMAHDVVTRLVKPGMPRQEVVGLLSGPAKGEKPKLECSLGECVRDGGDSLQIYFDSKGEVVRAKIR